MTVNSPSPAIPAQIVPTNCSGRTSAYPMMHGTADVDRGLQDPYRCSGPQMAQRGEYN